MTKRFLGLSFRAINALIVLISLTLATPSKAYGYIDPGSGSFVYQAIYAAFIGGTFYFRRAISRIFKRGK
jgi:hypothetical protein